AKRIVPVLPALRKDGATARKSTATTTAPMRAPTSGRARTRFTAPFASTRSSVSGVAGALMTRSLLQQQIDVLLVHEGGPGQDRLATADRGALGRPQPQRVHGLVALDVGLLVDRPDDVAVLDRLQRLVVEVEGGHLRVAAGLVHRLQRDHREGGAQREHVGDLVVLL